MVATDRYLILLHINVHECTLSDFFFYCCQCTLFERKKRFIALSLTGGKVENAIGHIKKQKFVVIIFCDIYIYIVGMKTSSVI